MAWDGILGAVDAAKDSKHQVVETEHLMKALLEQKDGLARRIFTKAGVDNTSLLQSTDDFISQQPKVFTIQNVWTCFGGFLSYPPFTFFLAGFRGYSRAYCGLSLLFSVRECKEI